MVCNFLERPAMGFSHSQRSIMLARALRLHPMRAAREAPYAGSQRGILRGQPERRPMRAAIEAIIEEKQNAASPQEKHTANGKPADYAGSSISMEAGYKEASFTYADTSGECS